MNVLGLFDGIATGRQALKELNIPVTNYYASEVDKYAIAVSTYQHPDILHLGDVTKWREWDIDWSSIDLVTGGFPCTPAGTKVKTISGYKNIEDIVAGDLVLTHTNTYKKVAVLMNKVADHVNIIKSQGCYNLRLTDEHPLYVVRDNKFSWIDAKDLTIDDYLTYNINDKSENINNLSEVECWLLGRYIADGVIDSEKNIPYFCIGKAKRELFESKISSYSHYICHEDRNCQEFYIRDQRLLELVSMCGKGALCKFVPQFILDLPKDLLSYFWDGYVAGDGHYDKKVNRWMFSTVSETLFLGIQDIIIKLFHKIPSCYVRKDKRKKTFNDTYNGQFYLGQQKNTFVKEGKLCTKVKEVERVSLSIPVYNFEVDGDNSYTLNNVIVHNCQAWSMAGKQLGDKDERGMLFWVMLDIMKHIKYFNPNVKFLIENVKMKKDFEEYITHHTTQALGELDKHLINSALVSGQNRQRYYWTNIKGITQPEDRGILLKDIIEDGFVDTDKSYCVDANYYKGGNLEQYFNKSRRQLVFGGAMRGRYLDENGKRLDSTVDSQSGLTQQRIEIRADGKSNCLSTVQKDSLCIQVGEADINGKDQIKRVYSPKGKSPTLTTMQGGHQEPKISQDNITWRKLTPLEYERLQTLPDNVFYVAIELKEILCLDQAKNYVNAVDQNPKLQKLVLSVDQIELQEYVNNVAMNIDAKPQLIKYIAPKSADMQTLKPIKECTLVNNLGQLITANNAEKSALFQNQEIEEVSAELIVPINLIEGKITHNGKVEQLLKGNNLYLLQNGGNVSRLSIVEIMQLVKNVGKEAQNNSDLNSIFTTLSRLGTKDLEAILIILYFFAKNVINGYIQTKIQTGSIYLSLTNGYTAKGTMNGKEVVISNSQRYKQCGNGWTLEVIKHILSFLDLESEN